MKIITKLVLCTLALAQPVVHASSTPDSPHLVTTGYGQVVATPDMAEFSVKVIESKSTAKGAKKAVDQAVTQFLEALASQGVKKDDKIFYDRHAGHLIELIDEKYHVIKDQDVVVVL